MTAVHMLCSKNDAEQHARELKSYMLKATHDTVVQDIAASFYGDKCRQLTEHSLFDLCSAGHTST